MGDYTKLREHVFEISYHDPNDILDYKITYTLPTGDTISTSTWTVSGITKVSDSFDSTSATIWVKEGTAGTIATALNHIKTVQNREFDSIIYFNVREVV